MGDVGCRKSPAKGDKGRDVLALRLEALNKGYGGAVVDTRVQADLVEEEDIGINSATYPGYCQDKHRGNGGTNLLSRRAMSLLMYDAVTRCFLCLMQSSAALGWSDAGSKLPV